MVTSYATDALIEAIKVGVGKWCCNTTKIESEEVITRI